MHRLIFFILLMTCSITWAAWEATGSEESGFYHEKSTRIQEGSVVKMWSMISFPSSISLHGARFRSVKILSAYDCKAETNATISIVRHSGSMGEGEIVFSGTFSDSELKWDPVDHDSAGGEYWAIACNKQ